MSKVYVIFQKSNHPIGIFTEPIKVVASEELANKWANARALSTNLTYTIGSYDLVEDEEFEIPNRVKIECLYNKELKEIVQILSMEPDVGDIKASVRTDVDTNKAWKDLCKLTTSLETVKSDNAYEDTINKYKEYIKTLNIT